MCGPHPCKRGASPFKIGHGTFKQKEGRPMEWFRRNHTCLQRKENNGATAIQQYGVGKGGWWLRPGTFTSPYLSISQRIMTQPPIHKHKSTSPQWAGITKQIFFECQHKSVLYRANKWFTDSVVEGCCLLLKIKYRTPLQKRKCHTSNSVWHIMTVMFSVSTSFVEHAETRDADSPWPLLYIRAGKSPETVSHDCQQCQQSHPPGVWHLQL